VSGFGQKEKTSAYQDNIPSGNCLTEYRKERGVQAADQYRYKDNIIYAQNYLQRS